MQFKLIYGLKKEYFNSPKLFLAGQTSMKMKSQTAKKIGN